MNKTKLADFDNSWYKPGAGFIKRTLWYYTNVLFFLNPWNPFSSLKVFLLRLYGAKIGEGVIIKPSVNIKYPWFLTVGNNVWIGEKVWIDNLAKVKIGDNVSVSQGAMLLCGNHNYKKQTFDLIVGEIKLEEGVWIGAKSIVAPGVTCKSHSILSVNSVASKNLEEYTIYQGNPAVEVRKRNIQ
ncbi:MAG: WcaF family extracellular polysaccharide biosynthesis acetyltransferase [Bacteroidales bacterium]|nr:WcaF family extracellular polysaccharide biosynthesis acetyltransferase [Bacteroidales bacterium]